MSELELFTIFHDHHAKLYEIMMDVVTINFAMIAAIFYFLNETRFPLKAFSFLVYSIGMTFFSSLNYVESQTTASALTALTDMPRNLLSLPSLHLIELSQGWIPKIETAAWNMAYWVLWLGVAYLLFFWRKDGGQRRARVPRRARKEGKA